MTHPARWRMVTAHEPASVRHSVGRERPEAGIYTYRLDFHKADTGNDLPARHSVRELQFPLDRLQARRLAQGVEDPRRVSCPLLRQIHLAQQ